MSEIRTIAVIGTGAMGRGIVQWAAEGGANVIAVDQRPGTAAEGKAFVADLFQRAIAKGRMSERGRDETLDRIKVAETVDAVAGADLVIEAIIEDIDAKRALFSQLEGIVRDDAILCTNTSSLSVTGCARDCKAPERVAGLHFFNPVPLMKVVEVIRGERTAPDVMERLLAFVAKTAHMPVVCSDTPGFVVNHAGRGIYTEGLRVVQEGIASFADVDRVMRDCVGFPLGPFELFDLTGLDVSSRVLREIYDSYFQEPRYRPSPLVYRRVEAGLLGRKVGQGFYRYDGGKKVEPTESENPQTRSARVFVDAPAGPAVDALASRLREGGMDMVASAAEAEILVVCPLGDDATTAALAAGHDPARVVAIDTLYADCLKASGRATLMATPVTQRDLMDAVHGALAKAGLRVTRISDSPGFIAQRILANIVNTACEIAQQRIASPGDIEAGVTRGLGYPKGPLALGDSIGARKVLMILERLQFLTGDPRYRPSLWLRRRANLDISLTTAE